MFCLGEQPPGDSRSPQCRLSIRSFEGVVAQSSESIQKLILARLAIGGRAVTSKVPASQRESIRVASAFPDLSEEHREAVTKLIKKFDKPELQARHLARKAYPASHIASALRSIGRMIGAAGPDRGFGSPRFLLETPVLALLVRATAKARPTVYAEWLDTVYERFGLILGIGDQHDFRAVLEDLDERMPIERALKENHNQLRMRLIRAGLAVEYSDSETEVRGLGDLV
jgi:hypothetical protein